MVPSCGSHGNRQKSNCGGAQPELNRKNIAVRHGSWTPSRDCIPKKIFSHQGCPALATIAPGCRGILFHDSASLVKFGIIALAFFVSNRSDKSKACTQIP